MLPAICASRRNWLWLPGRPQPDAVRILTATVRPMTVSVPGKHGTYRRRGIPPARICRCARGLHQVAPRPPRSPARRGTAWKTAGCAGHIEVERNRRERLAVGSVTGFLPPAAVSPNRAIHVAVVSQRSASPKNWKADHSPVGWQGQIRPAAKLPVGLTASAAACRSTRNVH